MDSHGPRRRWRHPEREGVAGARPRKLRHLPPGLVFAAAARYDGRRSLTGRSLLTLPALIALCVTMLYPVAWTVWLSLNGPNTALRGDARLQGARQLRSGSPEHRVPGRALADARHRRSRASCSKRCSGSPWRWRSTGGCAAPQVFRADRRPAADGGAGRRRARLAVHLRRRLRHDRLDRRRIRRRADRCGSPTSGWRAPRSSSPICGWRCRSTSWCCSPAWPACPPTRSRRRRSTAPRPGRSSCSSSCRC